MSDSTITGLPSASALSGTEVFPADQGSVTSSVLASQVKTYVVNNISTLPANVSAPGITGSSNNAVVATGTTQGNCSTQLSADTNVISSGTGGVLLHSVVAANKIVTVSNQSGASVNVYPASGHKFDTLAVNAPIVLLNNGLLELIASTTSSWNTSYQAIMQASMVVGTVANASNVVDTNSVARLSATTTGVTINGTMTSNSNVTGSLVIGTNSSTVNNPYAQVILSNFNDTNYETANIGLFASSQATLNDASRFGFGIYGHGYTNGSARAGGVVGEGLVTSTSDTGASVGVRGYAIQTHAGGTNIGVYGNATGGATNYDLYSLNGSIYSATGTLTNTGNFAASGSLNAGTTLTVGSGTTGIILQADTDGLSTAIYNTSVTPSNTNWAFKSTGAFSSIGGSSGSVLTANTANIVLATSTGAAVAGTLSATGNISVGSTPKVIIGATPPTIASGFGTSPTITAFSTAAFKVVVGTSPTGVGVLTFPTASTGWSCDVQNNTSNSTIVVGQTATTITSASFAAYSRTTGLAVNFNAGDVLTFTCMGF